MSETSRYTAAEVKVGRLFVGPPNAAGDLLVGTGIGSEYTQFAAGAPDQFLRVTPSGLNWTSVDLTDTTGSIGTSIITTGAAPAFQIRPLSASTGLSLSVVDGALTFANNSLLGSAGGGATLVATANAAGAPVIKSLIAGTGISLSSTDTDITITGDGGVVSSRWEIQTLVGTDILRQKDSATVNNLIWNSNVGNNFITTTFNPKNCAIIGGKQHLMNSIDSDVIFGGENNMIYQYDPNPANVTLGNSVFGGTSNFIMNHDSSGQPYTAKTYYCTISGGRNNSLQTKYNSVEEANSIFGGSFCQIVSGDSVLSSSLLRSSSIFGGFQNWINAQGTTVSYSNIIGGTSNLIKGTVNNSMIVNGRRFTIDGFNGALMIGDYSNNALSATAANQYTSRFAGGYQVFSNATSTTGMTMAAGGSSWVAVSDVNKKDIHGEVDYATYLEKLISLPVYEYNYKGNPREQRCIGPTAQDYHALFGCECIETEITENIVVGEQVLPQSKRKRPLREGEEEEEKERAPVPICEQVKKRVLCPAKDPLGIEQQDLIGICIAALKGLAATVNALDARLTALETA